MLEKQDISIEPVHGCKVMMVIESHERSSRGTSKNSLHQWFLNVLG